MSDIHSVPEIHENYVHTLGLHLRCLEAVLRISVVHLGVDTTSYQNLYTCQMNTEHVELSSGQ